MKKNYVCPSFSLKGWNFCWPKSIGQKAILNLSVITFLTMLSAQLSAQCPTVEGNVSISTTTICKNTKPGEMTLSGFSGDILKWQTASDADFTIDVVDLTCTDATLAQSEMTAISGTTYYRAVVQMDGCDVKYTMPVTVYVGSPVTYADGDWTGTPDDTTPIIITSDFAMPSNLTICSCLITNGATLTIPTDISLTVQNDLTVDTDSSIVVENDGSLIQVDDNVINTGSVTFKTNTTTMKQYDYSYWSSPVEGMTLHALSPNTLSDKYYSFNTLSNTWQVHPAGAANMEAGKGYIIRAPQGWSQSNATLGIFEGIFNGTPTNGLVPTTIKKGGSSYNLIGNPYPSAINLDLFLTDPVNEGLLNGTVYLWTHNTAISNLIPGNSIYNYTRDDYSKYNITGGVVTASTAISGGVRPTATLTSGQGFFIEANPELPDGTYTAQFLNYMRTDNNHDNISRPATNAATASPIQKHRVWINMSNTGGAYDEMLVGYVSGATNGLDRNYDGKTFPAGNVVSLYSILENNTLSIQGRAMPFSQNDSIPMGFVTTLAGTFSIGISDFDGLFENQNVYLFDKTLDIIHDLKASGYSFITAAGTFNNRFELRFINAALGVSQPSIDDMVVIKMGKEVWVQTAGTPMKTVEIFDLTGRLVFNGNNINASQFHTTAINASAQLLLVKVTLENNLQVIRKVILD